MFGIVDSPLCLNLFGRHLTVGGIFLPNQHTLAAAYLLVVLVLLLVAVSLLVVLPLATPGIRIERLHHNSICPFPLDIEDIQRTWHLTP